MLKTLWERYREGIAYLFFGGVATLLNLIVFVVFDHVFGSEFAAGPGNIINNGICILFAYFTNRTWVFQSKARGGVAFREFCSFVACRIGTAVLDQAILWLGVTMLGPRLIPEGSLALLGFAFENRKLWNLGVKITSQVIVIVSNYVFSKLFIFKKAKHTDP